MRGRLLRWGFVGAAAVGVVVGLALYVAGEEQIADVAWIVATSLGLGPAAWWVVQGLRHGNLGVDVLALAALVGTLAVGEYLAGALVTVMLATGRALEAEAGTRARRDLRAVVERQPSEVHRYRGTTVTTEPVEAVRRGDQILVKSGEVVAVDGVLTSATAVLDESSMTGESLPVEHKSGEAVRSGTVNAGPPFDLRATTVAADSTYAAIVRLVEQAEASSAPLVRLADRYAGVFLGLTAVVAGLAWALTGDPVRAVAVLVVATPCPLILAAPVAIVSGLSRAARRGVVMKGGAALERMARGRVLLFDKTGTLTIGSPTLTEVLTAGGRSSDEVVRLAASLDQMSTHVLASAVVTAALERGLPLTLPSEVDERAGQGIRGQVAGRDVRLGKAAWTGATESDPWVRSVHRRADLDSSLTVFVGIDGAPAGALLFADPIRLDAARTVRRLRRGGIDRVVMVTGDRADVAESVGAMIGVDEVFAERTPADKVDAVALTQRWGPTMMVGDGINDAPALAAADVGVALGARGASVASAAADVVVVVDRLDRLGDGVAIARRTMAVARQSVVAGIGLSIVAMLLAAAGWIPPAWGALLQEAIDLAVILNALRALGGVAAPRAAGDDIALAQRFGREHLTLRPELERLQSSADSLGEHVSCAALAEVRDVHRFLVEELLPHEWAEDERLYPALARHLGGDEATATMRREHVEIARLVRRLGRVLDEVGDVAPPTEELLELRRLLYGLVAVLRLHFAEEDERYYSFADETPAAERSAR
jgi:heavy metal translocating P-type ATPase